MISFKDSVLLVTLNWQKQKKIESAWVFNWTLPYYLNGCIESINQLNQGNMSTEAPSNACCSSHGTQDSAWARPEASGDLLWPAFTCLGGILLGWELTCQIRQVRGGGGSRWATCVSTTLRSSAKVTTLLRKVTLGETRSVLYDSGIRMSWFLHPDGVFADFRKSPTFLYRGVCQTINCLPYS